MKDLGILSSLPLFIIFIRYSVFGCKIIETDANLSRNKIYWVLGNSQNLWGRLENGTWDMGRKESRLGPGTSQGPDQPTESASTLPTGELLFDERMPGNSEFLGLSAFRFTFFHGKVSSFFRISVV